MISEENAKASDGKYSEGQAREQGASVPDSDSQVRGRRSP